MQATQLKKEGLASEFKVVVPSKEVDERVATKLAQYAKKAKVDGFRPGKVPENVVLQRYGDEVLQEAMQTSIESSTDLVLKDNGISPATKPKVNVTAFDKGKDLEFTLTVESLPEIKLQGFKKIELEKLLVKVDKSDIDKALNIMIERHKKYKELTKPRAAKLNDLVSIIATFKVAGEVWNGIENKNIDLEVGSNDVIFADIDKKLKGAKVGDELSVDSECPKDFPIEDLAGKTLTSEFKIEKIQEKIVFKADDEFAKDVGLEDLKSLKEAIEKTIADSNEKASRMLVKRRLLDRLSDDYKFELPPTMVENEFKAIWDSLQQEIEEAKQTGVYKGDKDDLRADEATEKEYRNIAERRVLLGLVISEIAKDNKITLTTEEIRRTVYEEAMKHKGQEKEVVEFYRKTPQALDSLCSPKLEDKVVDFILDSANLKEREVDMKIFREEIKGILPVDMDDDIDEEPEDQPN